MKLDSRQIIGKKNLSLYKNDINQIEIPLVCF